MLKFIIGIFAGFHIYGLMQDIMGKEDYIKYVTEHWRPSAETCPIHLILIIVFTVIAAAFEAS